MDYVSFSSVLFYGFVIFILLVIFVLPNRKLKEEKGKEILFSERCSVYWRVHGLIGSGGNLPARITFYDKFFVVARVTIAKFYFKDITKTLVYESYAYDNNGSLTGICNNSKITCASTRNFTLTWDAHNRASQTGRCSCPV